MNQKLNLKVIFINIIFPCQFNCNQGRKKCGGEGGLKHSLSKNIKMFLLRSNLQHNLLKQFKDLPTTESVTVCFSRGFVLTWKEISNDFANN